MNSSKPYLRHERVSKLIRKELGEIILHELEFNGAIMTIVGVDVTKKIDYARIHICILPSFAKASKGRPSAKEIEKAVLDKLNANRRQLQGLLLRKINIRPMPEISFEIDRGTERAAEIEKVFIDEERGKNI